MERITGLLVLAVCCANAVSQPTVDRIANGQVAESSQFPYAVSLQLMGSQLAERGHRCGGALVTLQHAVTAASCLFDVLNNNQVLITASQYRVFAGTNLLTNDTSAELFRTVANFTIHPNYIGPPALVNNVAIITLLTPFARNIVTPLSLPDVNYDPADFTLCTVAGWGAATSAATASANLRFATKYVYNHNLCTALYNGIAGTINILPTMMCAASYDIISSGCAGDDGNALVCDNVFAGILSKNDACSSSSYPEVYARVNNYTTWIRSVSASPSLFNHSTFVFSVLGFIVQLVFYK